MRVVKSRSKNIRNHKALSATVSAGLRSPLPVFFFEKFVIMSEAI